MNDSNSGPTEKNSSNDEFLENGVSKKIDKINVKTKKRKKCVRDKAAPRPPLSGYIRFLNDRREQFRAENPNLPFAEITKVLATEWNQLPADRKQQYLLAAEQERVNYVQELAAYKKTDAHRNFIQRKMKKKKINVPVEEVQELEIKKEKEIPSNDNNNTTVCDIPIFSEEFLNFNKAREMELRYLRKTVTDREQEVCVLDKHIENMKNGVIRLTANTQQLKLGCMKYEQYLNNLRSKFRNANISLPDYKMSTSDDIDKKVATLVTLLQTSTDQSLIANMKKAVSNINVSQLL